MKRCLLLSAALLLAAQTQVIASDKTTAHDSLKPMRDELMRRAAQHAQQSAHQNVPQEQANNHNNAYNPTPTPVTATLPAQAAAVIHYNSNPQPAFQQPAPQAAPAVSRTPSQGHLVPANNNQIRGDDLGSYLFRVILAEGLPWLARQTGRGLYGLCSWSQTRQNPRPGNNN